MSLPCLLHPPSDLLYLVALPRLHSTPKSWDFLEVHNLSHHCTCTDALQEELGGPCQAAQPGEVWIREEGCAVNKSSTTAEQYSQIATRIFILNPHNLHWQVSRVKDTMQLVLKVSLTNGGAPMLRHKASGQVHSPAISKFASVILRSTNQAPAVPKDFCM